MLTLRINVNKFFKSLLLTISIPAMLLACDRENWIEGVAEYVKFHSPKTSELIIIQDDQIIIINVRTGSVQYIFDDEAT